MSINKAYQKTQSEKKQKRKPKALPKEKTSTIKLVGNVVTLVTDTQETDILEFKSGATEKLRKKILAVIRKELER